MKRIILSISLAVTSITAVFAQNAFEKGTNMVGAYVGLGSRYNFGSYGTNYSSHATPWLGVTFDNGTFALTDPAMTISLGGLVGFQSLGQKWTATYWDSNTLKYVTATDSWNYTFIVLGPRGAFHYTWEKAEAYGGLMIGYTIVSAKYTSTYPGAPVLASSASSGLGVGIFAGGRYLFTNHIGVFGELGYGTSYLNLGVCFKL